MGKPATTYFCGNGHLLEDNAHHEFGPRDMRDWEDGKGQELLCPYCGSTEEFMTIEWTNEDYWQDGEPEVPLVPIRYLDFPQTDHKGNKYFAEIGVYDISALRARRKGS